MKNKPTILLLGSYGRGNAGDDAFLLAASQLFSAYTLVINAYDKKSLPKGLNLKSVSTKLHKDIFHKTKYILSSKYIIYGGGDLWVDLYGSRFPRRSLWFMLILNIFACIMGKKVIYLGVGAGNIVGFSKKLAVASASLASLLILRDHATYKIIGINDATVLPDLTINLPIEPRTLTEGRKKREKTIVVSALYHIPEAKQNFDNFIREFAAQLSRFSSNKYRLLYVPMLITNNEEKDDLWVGRQLMAHLPHGKIEILNYNNLDTLIRAIAKADLVIGVRLHANILATWNGVPSLGVAYRPKVRSFFAEQNLSEYCIGLDQLPLLYDVGMKMLENHDHVTNLFKAAATRSAIRRSDYQKLASKVQSGRL